MFYLTHSLWAICLPSHSDGPNDEKVLPRTTVLHAGQTGEWIADLKDSFAQVQVDGCMYAVSADQFRLASEGVAVRGASRRKVE
jgi:hypothetical protein